MNDTRCPPYCNMHSYAVVENSIITVFPLPKLYPDFRYRWQMMRSECMNALKVLLRVKQDVRYTTPRCMPHGRGRIVTHKNIWTGQGTRSSRMYIEHIQILRAFERFQPSDLPAHMKRNEIRRQRRGPRVNSVTTHLSRIASCQRCNFATSFTWKPKIRGWYRSARSATAAVLMASPRPSVPSTSSSRGRPRRRGSSTVAPAPGTMPTAPRVRSVGPLLRGRSAG
jgi:hypothetical protein